MRAAAAALAALVLIGASAPSLVRAQSASDLWYRGKYAAAYRTSSDTLRRDGWKRELGWIQATSACRVPELRRLGHQLLFAFYRRPINRDGPRFEHLPVVAEELTWCARQLTPAVTVRYVRRPPGPVGVTGAPYDPIPPRHNSEELELLGQAEGAQPDALLTESELQSLVAAAPRQLTEPFPEGVDWELECFQGGGAAFLDRYCPEPPDVRSNLPVEPAGDR